ncbi:MAG TPA: hypothetical protein VM681_00540 [Candidatus Thermoplasmatota archaeon]|nr:hypothetical protein [Candidatus Thermoplasmatota archaeon]
MRVRTFLAFAVVSSLMFASPAAHALEPILHRTSGGAEAVPAAGKAEGRIPSCDPHAGPSCALDVALAELRSRSPRVYDLLRSGAPSVDADVLLAQARLADVAELLRSLAGDVVLPPLQAAADYASLEQASCAFLDQDGRSCDDAYRSYLRFLDALPRPLVGKLLGVVNSFHDMHAAARAMFAESDRALAPEGTPDPAQRARLIPVVEAQARLAGAVLALERALQDVEVREALSVALSGHSCPAAPGAAGLPLERWPVWIDLASCDNDYGYELVPYLLVDAGGNDVYHGFTGGTRQMCAPSWNYGTCYTFAGALLDLGGNDRYRPLDGYYYFYDGTMQPLSGGVNGGAHELGAGFLWDSGGHDTYDAGGYGANGGGSDLASGFLLDRGGNDVYQTSLTTYAMQYASDPRDDWYARAGGANGGAFRGGVGLLVDAAGSDSYTSLRGGANGGGQYGGGGFLLDLAGDDHYLAGALGTNGGANGEGAMGNLWDAAGNDAYVVHDRLHDGQGANGGGSAAGSGALFDLAGNDAYGVSQDTHGEGANGAGIGLGRGLLLDLAGDDEYGAPGALANGAAEGYASGLLVDAGGYDRFRDASGSCSNDERAAIDVSDCTRLHGPTPWATGARVDLPHADATAFLWTAAPVLHREDFESREPGHFGGAQWHVTDCRAHKSERSLAFNQAHWGSCPGSVGGPYADNTWVESGWFFLEPWRLPLEAPLLLRWQSWHYTRESPEGRPPVDVKRVWLVVDGAFLPAPLHEETGPQKQWNARVKDLSHYAGSTIQIVFQFDSVTRATQHEGWFVDDVEVVASSAASLPFDPDDPEGFVPDEGWAPREFATPSAAESTNSRAEITCAVVNSYTHVGGRLYRVVSLVCDVLDFVSVCILVRHLCMLVLVPYMSKRVTVLQSHPV